MVHKSQDDTASHVISCPHMTCHMSHDRSNVDATVAVVRCYIAVLNRSVGVHPEGVLGERDSAWRSWRLIHARGTTLVQLEWLTQTGYSHRAYIGSVYKIWDDRGLGGQLSRLPHCCE